jgi:hypothetical protein
MARLTRKNRNKKHPWAIVQYDDRPLSKIYLEFIERNRAYCEKHGYEYIFTSDGYENLPPYWRKTQLVKDLLMTDKYKGILWLDTDACIFDMDRKLSTIDFKDYDFYFSKDLLGTNFCAGVWMVKNTRMGKEIMAKWMGAYEPESWRRKNGKWRTENSWAGRAYEQGAFEKEILPEYIKHMKEYPHTMFQSSDWTDPRTFILHFYSKVKGACKKFLDANPLVGDV